MSKTKAKQESGAQDDKHPPVDDAASAAAQIASEEKAKPDGAAARKKKAAGKAAAKAAKKLKKLQESLRLSDSKMRDFVEGNGKGIGFHEAIYDDDDGIADYRVVDINPAYETLLAVAADEVVAGLASEIYGKRRAPFLDDIAAAIDSGEPRYIEGTIKTTRKRLGITIQPMGKKLFALVVTDTSEDQRARRRRAFLETRVKTLTAERDDIKATLSARIGRLEPEVKTLKKDLAASEAELKTTNPALSSAKKALTKEQQKRKKLETDLAAASEARDRLKEVLGDLNKAVKDG